MAETQRIMVTVTNEQARRLDRVTDETGVSRSAVVALALADYLAKWEKEHTTRAGYIEPSSDMMGWYGYVDVFEEGRMGWRDGLLYEICVSGPYFDELEARAAAEKAESKMHIEGKETRARVMYYDTSRPHKYTAETHWAIRSHRQNVWNAEWREKQKEKSGPEEK